MKVRRINRAAVKSTESSTPLASLTEADLQRASGAGGGCTYYEPEGPPGGPIILAPRFHSSYEEGDGGMM